MVVLLIYSYYRGNAQENSLEWMFKNKTEEKNFTFVYKLYFNFSLTWTTVPFMLTAINLHMSIQVSQQFSNELYCLFIK